MKGIPLQLSNMNAARIEQLNKKVDKMLSFKKVTIFPILGGASSGEPHRDVTSEEAEILHLKGVPCPIAVSFKREEEFQRLLNNE